MIPTSPTFIPMSAKIIGIPRLPALGAETGEMSLEDMLAAHKFVRDLAPHLRRILFDLAMRVSFIPNEFIFREGDPANRFYLIHTGKVGLEAHLANGECVPVQTLGAGDVLGWSWLFPPSYWHFDARALAMTEAVYFFGTPLRTECESDHELGYELLKRMSAVVIQRLHATRRQLLDCCTRRAASHWPVR